MEINSALKKIKNDPVNLILNENDYSKLNLILNKVADLF